MEERLLTPEEVASILAVSPKSVREWLRRGKLKGVKAGRLWRVRKRDLDTFLDFAVQTLESSQEDLNEPLTEEEKRKVASEAKEALLRGNIKL